MEDTRSTLLEPQPQLETPPPDERDARRLTVTRLLADCVKSVVITITIFLLLVTYVIQGFKVYGSCMEPNLMSGERLLGNKLVYHFTTPQRGDVVIFRYPKDPAKIYIKRVIALPGEMVEIRGGQVTINDRPLREPYLVHIPHGDFGPERVETGNLFVMGDYRDCSNDSRFWGQLPESLVQAKAWLRYWPANRLEVVK